MLEKAYITFIDGLRGEQAVAADNILFDDVVTEIRKWGRPVRLDFHKVGKTEDEGGHTSVFFSVEGPVDPTWSEEAREKLIQLELKEERERLKELERRKEMRQIEKEQRIKARKQELLDRQAAAEAEKQQHYQAWKDKRREGYMS